jgi:hypothetical protein
VAASEEWLGHDRYDVYPSSVLGSVADSVIRIVPADLTTGATPEPQIWLWVPRQTVSPDEVAALAARYRLVTWPDRRDIPMDPVHTEHGGRLSNVSFRPREGLKEGWYAIRATGDPSELAPPYLNPRDGDAAVARFRVGETPIVQQVSARTTSRATAIQIAYTQRVVARPQSYEVSVGGVVEPRCRLHNTADMEAPGAALARIICPPLSWSSLVLRQVEPLFGPGGDVVSSADGVPMDEIDLPFGEGAGDGSHRREVVPVDGDGEVVVLLSAFGLEGAPTP